MRVKLCLVCIASWYSAEAGDTEGSWWMSHPDFWKQGSRYSLSLQVGQWQQTDQITLLALSRYKCTKKKPKPWIFRISKIKAIKRKSRSLLWEGETTSPRSRVPREEQAPTAVSLSGRLEWAAATTNFPTGNFWECCILPTNFSLF